MCNSDMVFIVKYQQRNPYGEIESHMWCKRVSTGREGIELRNHIVSDGPRVDDRIVVTECRCIPLTDEGRATAA